MSDPLKDLRRLLNASLTESPEDPSGSTREAHLIDFLIGIMMGYGIGDYDTAEVVAIFKHHAPGFDILSWIKSKEADGFYNPD